MQDPSTRDSGNERILILIKSHSVLGKTEKRTKFIFVISAVNKLM